MLRDAVSKFCSVQAIHVSLYRVQNLAFGNTRHVTPNLRRRGGCIDALVVHGVQCAFYLFNLEDPNLRISAGTGDSERVDDGFIIIII